MAALPRLRYCFLPAGGTERGLAIGVGRYRRRATLHNALSEVSSFGLSRSEGVAIAQTMQQVVRTNWEPLCVQNGFSALEIERLRNCFLACDEPLRDLGSL